MKKFYFLISASIAFLAPGLVASSTTSFFSDSDNETDTTQVDIEAGKYLSLAYKNGKFYSWNQIDSVEQHAVGLFVDKDDQSYLVDNVGVFWNLDYQVNTFYRISNNLAIANIKYYKDSQNVEHLNKNFLIILSDESGKNELIVQDTPINSEKNTFTMLKNTDENNFYVVASGNGLDLIHVSKENDEFKIDVKQNLIGDYAQIFFYELGANEGIFVNNDNRVFYLTNIKENPNQVEVKDKQGRNLWIAVNKRKNNVVHINENHLVIRDSSNILHFGEISNDNIVLDEWEIEGSNLTSKANNFAFIVNEETFILNVDGVNSSSLYGVPYLVKTSNFKEVKKIDEINSINDFMFTKDDSNGVFIDKNLKANLFTYNEDDTFTISEFGTINSFQYINKELFFATSKSNNLLLSENSDATWSLISNIKVTERSSSSRINFLNNMINKNTNDYIDYKNSYFSNGSANIDITDNRVTNVTIKTNSVNRILEPKNNNVNYNFLNSEKYQVGIHFNLNNEEKSLNYQVNIDSDFTNRNLLTVEPRSLVSYVGVANEKLYDIKTIDQRERTFKISNFDYDYLHYVELFTYGDATDTVVKNVHIVKEGTEINVVINSEFPEQDQIFFGLKMRNLLDQVSWTYLGFIINGQRPMVDFWETDYGKNLMIEAMDHRILEKDLREMNSIQINKLIQDSITWHNIAVQGKAIAITIVSIFALALAGVVASVGYNIFINKKIEIVEVEKNKTLKTPFEN